MAPRHPCTSTCQCGNRHCRGPVRFDFPARPARRSWPRYWAKFHAEHDPWEDVPFTECAKCHLSFSTTDEALEHIIASPRHFKCDICIEWHAAKPGEELNVEEFESASALHTHRKKRHDRCFCEYCDEFFPDFKDHADHLINEHCHGCNICSLEDVDVFPTGELLEAHYRSAEHIRKLIQLMPQNVAREKKFPGHYGTLHISPKSSQHEVFRAAKAMRINTHPDRLKKQGGLTEGQKTAIDVQAALVGEAADVLSDPRLREKYDRKMRIFNA